MALIGNSYMIGYSAAEENCKKTGIEVNEMLELALVISANGVWTLLPSRAALYVVFKCETVCSDKCSKYYATLLSHDLSM